MAVKIRKKLQEELSSFTVGEHNVDEVIAGIVSREVPPKFIVIDLFCGAGGTSTGFEMTDGQAIVIACVNHDYLAIKSHWRNYPHIAHFEEDIRTLKLEPLVKLLNHYRRLYPDAKVILWASLECTNFSKAKGGQARDADSRTLADHLDRYILALNPDYVQIENVVEFMSWGPLDVNGKPVSRKNGSDWMRWRNHINTHGYYDEWRELNSADYGAYTSRNRLFGCFAKVGLPIMWPVATHGKVKPPNKGTLHKIQENLFKTYGPRLPWKAVKDVLDFADEGKSIFDRNIPLSEKTLERIYAGLVKYVAGGKDNFLAKIYAVASNSDGTYSTESAAHTITTRDAHALVQPTFLSTYNGGNDEFRNQSIEDPCKTLTTRNAHALVNAAFISKYYTGKPDGKNIPVTGPAGTITCVDSQALVQAAFITQRNTGDPESKLVDINGPARTLTGTGGNQDIVRPEFITAYNGNGCNSGMEEPSPTVTVADRLAVVQPKYLLNYNHSSDVNDINEPSPAIVAADKLAVVNPSFIMRDFTNGGNSSSIDAPAGSILPYPKMNLVTAEAFIMNTNFTNAPTSIEEPLPVITANRKWQYLVNPSWGGNMGDVNAPCPVIVARQDKAPLYLVVSEGGDIAIRIEDTDSECMRKIKEFMVIYGIVDIKMRMLKVMELLKIQGFPEGYHLDGNQSDQKKFIGNSVVPHVVKVWALAMAERFDNGYKKVA